jgi:hypothetical protein
MNVSTDLRLCSFLSTTLGGPWLVGWPIVHNLDFIIIVICSLALGFSFTFDLLF